MELSAENKKHRELQQWARSKRPKHMSASGGKAYSRKTKNGLIVYNRANRRKMMR